MQREVEAGADAQPAGIPAPTAPPAGVVGNDLAALAAPSEPTGRSLLRLFRFERRWLAARVRDRPPLDADPTMPLGARDVPMGRFVDDLLANAPLLTVLGLRAALWMVMLAPLPCSAGSRTFTRPCRPGAQRPARSPAPQRPLPGARVGHPVQDRRLPRVLRAWARCSGAWASIPTDSTPPAWAREVAMSGAL